MQTRLAEAIRDTDYGREAEGILRSCVHCGFCNATCPTYQLLGDELDGPRGRIYLIKQLLEGTSVSRKTQLHLDRCLTCKSCETTCPSGVQYGRLLDIGRRLVERQVSRDLPSRVLRKVLRLVLPYPQRLRPLLGLARIVARFLPSWLRKKLPLAAVCVEWPQPRHDRVMLVLDGCVQSSVSPQINLAAARVLDKLGISLIRIRETGCCGAVSQHLSEPEEAAGFVRHNIDVWWPWVESGTECIVMTASGCGVMVRDYGELLKHDPEYAGKARRISELTRDLSEVLASEDLSVLDRANRGRVAFHSPCTLQHGQRVEGLVEQILADTGYELSPVANAHLCCGSAGTYSILQETLSERLLADKVRTLEDGGPVLIATANIGCLLHLQSGTALPVRHWVELLAD
ncbi:MAG: glycolate oxidase subunit GlcF [Pseudomonadota bacterium]|nr:glycolate oxidase subunit GlcF [Pseudomonadota bacterium]